MVLDIKPISVLLQRGVPSNYYIMSLGTAHYWCDEDGIVEMMAKWMGEDHHPAYQDQWDIKEFDCVKNILMPVRVSIIARMVRKATAKHIMKVSGNGCCQLSL